MFQPKIIEKDLKCRSQHSQLIEFVILDQNIPDDTRLICKICENIQPNLTIVEYCILKKLFDEQQMERIKQFEIIVTPHIGLLQGFSKILATTRKRSIQLFDVLIRLSHDWINSIVKLLHRYSGFGQSAQQKETIIHFQEVIKMIKNNHKNYSFHMNHYLEQQLEQFQKYPEFKFYQEIINILDKLTTQQEQKLIYLQNETPNLLESLLSPFVFQVEILKNNFSALKTRSIQQLDHLIWLTDDWIQAMTESITTYSFFEQLNNVISLQETFIDSNQLIDNTRKIHQDWKIKIDLKLESIKLFSEFKQFQRLFEDLERLTNKQNDELKSQQKIRLQQNSFIAIIQQQIRNSLSQGVPIFEDFIYKLVFGSYICYKKKFSIQKTQNNSIYTSSNGEIIRSDQNRIQQELLKKWEQILNLQWIGQFGQDDKKIGNWRATWKGETMQNVGGEYSSITLNQLYINGNKQGQWVDIFPNYWSEAKVVEIGQYNNNKRSGSWRYKYGDKELGGGNYNQLGVKIGKWIELLDGFWMESQVTYIGDYNMKGMKIGRWDILYCKKDEKEYNGGGSYDQEGNEKKIGKWIELVERFYLLKQITQNGEYNMNGIKVGRWDILYCKKDEKEYKEIGGGSYDQEGKQKKIGKWIEVDNGFYLENKQIYQGEYNRQGMKIGRWDSMYCAYVEKEYKKIGGGYYDQDGNQKKIGKWVELDEEFRWDKQATYIGEYNRQGMKIGRWDIMFENQKIGGGLYDLDGNLKKIGIWVELDKEFTDVMLIVCVGEYNANQMKIGRWNKINLQLSSNKCGLICFGGQYDEDGNKKIGKWVELDQNFQSNQFTYSGEYNIQGMKIGRWDSMFENNKFGGGLYDQDGHQKKIGQWVELDQNFKSNQLTYSGEYNLQGLKIGRWDIMFENKQFGGGLYDQDGHQKKIGQWVELDQNFKSNQFTYSGEYNLQGLKIGRWDIIFENKQFGGGLYDQDGHQKKIGQWVELDQNFKSNQFTYSGKYNIQGMKIERWDIMFENKQFGGGSYDQDGNQKKIGKWVELDQNFKSNQFTYSGQYNIQGMKIGRWVTMYDSYGGSYDQDGNQKKIGQWVELDENFKSNQFTYSGEYNLQGMKIGSWDSMFAKNKFGGGSYDQSDQDGNQKKFGKWVELDEGFNWSKQVTYSGQYNMQGVKIGRWDSMYDKYKLIGGGSYDQDGNQKKIGKWVELDQNFQYNQFTYSGEYNMQGSKIGRWDYMLENKKIILKYKEYSAGGQYDKDGNQKKIGKWVELDDKFQFNKFIYIGEYNIQGMKIGRWDSIYGMYDFYFQIAGGSYDQDGNQKKIGNWVELDQQFDKQLTYIGEYNLQGMKIGRWDSMYDTYKQIGGGSYDKDGNQKKIGMWVELDEKFKSNQFTYSGEYNMQCMKIGRWDSLFENKKFGGGSYDKDGNQKKIGMWVELDEKFKSNQFTYSGEYNMQGMKIGRWDSFYDGYKQIGGGSYGSSDGYGNQKKIGKWIELDEGFNWSKQVAYSGQYNMQGMKIGNWVNINIK